ncbi:hypothetical protein B0T26DRAFT_658267, partial [Lasiosphaeria miniovina]
PAKHEPARRRVRGLAQGQWVFDTLNAEYVWEHLYYPLFYIPLVDIESGPGNIAWSDAPDSRGFCSGTISVAQKMIEVVRLDRGPLKGLVKIPVNSLDAWFVEDEKLVGPHPKDPYKRIECLPSTREVLVQVAGVTVARSTHSVFLFETGLRTRYYLSPTSILDWSMLTPSTTTSFCPYKGQASYYHVKVPAGENTVTVEDAIWYYTYPTVESAQIQNRLCFYNEKVDIWLDGVKEDRQGTTATN